MPGTSAHIDTFCRDNLPEPEAQPDFSLDNFDYPDTLNVGYELTDAMVDKGLAITLRSLVMGDGERIKS